jgi:CPA2 family monovalent cation:H+ antiporter-2
MEDLGLVGNLAVVAIAALVGGAIARVLRLPTILGYLAAGLAIGPNTPGFVGDADQVQTVADLGVALLMFTLGIRFSIRELNRVRGVAVLGGLSQIGIMLALGFLLGEALGLTNEQAFVYGSVAAISSTMVALRLLEDRGEIGAPVGRVTVALALMQDLAVVPIIAMIPVIAGEEEDLALELGLAAAKGLALLATVWAVSTFVVPWVFTRVTLARSRELFLLTVVALALGTASVSFLAGLSLAFGAFLAGLLVSESEYAHRTLAEVFPLREIFAVVFFVGVGMLIDPASFLNDTDIVLSLALFGVFAKVVLITAIALLFGYTPRAAIIAGMALGNMGEFSFVIATEALADEIVDARLNGAILAAVLLSIALSPLLFLGQGILLSALRSVPGLRRPFAERVQTYASDTSALVNHAVICGFDGAGQEVARALSTRGFKFLVIDEDPVSIRNLREANIPCILGDPSLPTVLEQAELERARVLAVTLSDAAQSEAVVRMAREINPRLDIVARGGDEESHTRLRQAGAAEVVHADFEVGMEFVRHTLHRFGIPSQEIQALLARRRRDFSRG